MALSSIPASALSISFNCNKPSPLIKPSPKSFDAKSCVRSPNIVMNNAMASAATINAVVEGLPRRTANHHGNLWDDDFIQSVPKLPYHAPEYQERADTLVGKVKNMFHTLVAADSSAQNILRRLEMVNKDERLRIRRHFERELAEALDYVYRFWNETSKDLNTAALGLRILRLHRYPVSSDVLEKFKDKDGQFLSCGRQSEEEIISVLDLYRASLIVFPNEKIMDEVKEFSTLYLKQVWQKSHMLYASQYLINV